MAIASLNPASAADNEPIESASAQAFMRAFRDFKRIDDPPTDLTHTPEFQYAMYAFEGAQERACVKMANDHDEAALAALVAFGKLQIILDGGYVPGGGPLDSDEATELVAVQRALRSLWRYHDRQGAQGVREYAKYVGAPEHHDLIAWGDGR